MKILARLWSAANRRCKGFRCGRHTGKRGCHIISRRRSFCLWGCNCWCSFETLHVLLKLLLLCVASCSWSLLIISLSLSTSQQPSRHIDRFMETKLLEDEQETDPCLLCMSHHGPSKSFTKTFHRPLQRILTSVNNLDLPLVPGELRIHLAIIKVILVQLLKKLKLTDRNDLRSSKASKRKMPVPREALDAIYAEEQNSTDIYSSTLACPDVFLGTLAGYPRYRSGFVTHKCTAAKLEETVSIIIWNIERNEELLKHWENKHVALYLLLNSSWMESDQSIKILSQNVSLETSLKTAMEDISTPYVLLAPGLHSLRDDINFNRLIYVSEKTGVPGVSGSIRAEEDGRWRSGCQLFKMFDGHLLFTRGYSASIYECQLCHIADGPLLVRTKWLKNSKWPPNNANPEMILPYLYFLLNKNSTSQEHPILVCPDVMFNMQSLNVIWDKKFSKSTSRETKLKLLSMWRPIAKEKKLSLISLASGTRLQYPCSYLRSNQISEIYSRGGASGKERLEMTLSLRGCLERELKYFLTKLKSTCDNLNFICALSDDIVNHLIYYGDKMTDFYLNRTNSEVVFKVLKKVHPSFYRRHLDLNSLSSNGSSLLITGDYWRIRILFEERKTRGIYRMLQVLNSFWLLCEFPSEIKPYKGASDKDRSSLHLRNYDMSKDPQVHYHNPINSRGEFFKQFSNNADREACVFSGQNSDLIFNPFWEDHESWSFNTFEKCI